MRRKLIDVFKFSKPKGIGFGISKSFYCSVLTGSAVMPSVVDLLNPEGKGGALEGFGVPLTGGTDKARLEAPMERGVYAFATKDRKTVLQVMVLSKEEAGFSPEPFLRAAGAHLSADMAARIRATWQLVQFRFESHDPMVWPAVDFLLGVAGRMADMTQGVVADPVSQRYRMPAEVRYPRVQGESFHVLDVVEPKSRRSSLGEGVHVYTLGMQKFNLPELEFSKVGEDVAELAAQYLLGVETGVLKGQLLNPGDTVGTEEVAFQVAEGGLDRGVWDGVPCFELIPLRGEVDDCLRMWGASS